MRLNKHVGAFLLMFLAVLLFLPQRVLAAGSIDPDHDVSLTISYQDGDILLSGAQFCVYLTATLDAYGELTPTEDFEAMPVEIQGENDEAWRAMAATLEGYVLRDSLMPTAIGQTDDKGMLSFTTDGDGMTVGLYLVTAKRHTQDGRYYDAAPLMVMLPGLDAEKNEWRYDVQINPKYDSEPVPPETEKVTRKVLKIWKDEEYEQQRPKNITVQLLRDGEVYDTVTLNADNDWRYAWQDLDAGSRWMVVEQEVEGYTVTMTQEGVTFVVTNTCTGKTIDTPPSNPSKPSGTKLPQTGQLWWPVPLLFCAGVLLVIVGLIRRRGRLHEEK